MSNAVAQNKYTFQVGLKDVDFELMRIVEVLGYSIPFRSIDQAEKQCKTESPTGKVIDTCYKHQILALSSPGRYSGFMDCAPTL